MGLETATHIADLVSTNPLGSDGKNEGDDHLRLIKSVLKTDFPLTDGKASIVAATNVAVSSTPSELTKIHYRMVVMTLTLTISGALGSSVLCTLPAGYRPVFTHFNILGEFTDASAGSIGKICMFGLDTAGALSYTFLYDGTALPAPANGDSFVVRLVFLVP